MIQTIKDVFLITYLIWIIISYYLKYIKKIKTKEEFVKRRDLYYFKNKLNKTIDLSFQIIDKFQLNDDEEINIYLVLADCYYKQKNYVTSIEYFNKAFKILFTTKKEYYFSDLFVTALKSLIILKRFEDAKKLYHQIIEGKENNKDFKKLIRFAQKDNLT